VTTKTRPTRSLRPDYIIALDAAKTTGYVVGSPGGKVEGYGEQKFKSKARQYGPLFHGFAAWLDDMIKAHPNCLVVFEKPSHLRYYSAVRIGVGLASVIELVTHKNNVPVCELEPAAIKKHATGKGNANKDAMVEAGQAKWGDMCHTDNIADALWLYDAFLKNMREAA
jgi:Holliday junction resolvasome RuvABC endonuclease subunit